MVTDNELNKFAEIIDKCRNLAETVNVTVEISLSYIFSQLYGKALLTMCEIYTLLKGGYPEGAMTLTRNTYETMIVMTYLYDKKEDQKLIERFYDDYSVKTCSDHIKYLKWVIDNGKNTPDISKRLHERNDEYKLLTEKYCNFTSGKDAKIYFKQYWWAGKNMSFKRLCIETGFTYNYLYDISCYRVHSGMTGSLRFDNTEEGLLIGSCDSGKEIPMKFAITNFAVSTKLYFDLQGMECSEILSNIKTLLKLIGKL